MHLRCYTCWWISNQFEQKWPQYKHERSQFTAKFDLTSGLFDLTSKQFYYVKIQSIPSQVNFDLTRGMSLQAWSLQEGSGAVVPFPCDVSCYCFWACLLIGRACPVCRIWFDRVRAKHHQILNTRQARPIRRQWTSQGNGMTAGEQEQNTCSLRTEIQPSSV